MESAIALDHQRAKSEAGIVHISLPHRRNLIAKTMTHAAFGGSVGEKPYDDTRDAAFELVERQAKATISSPRDERLDAFLEHVGSFTSDALRKMPGINLCDRSTSAIDKFTAASKAVSCEACAARAGAKICDGTAEDDVTVEKGGDCLRDIERLVAAARETATAYYQKYSSQFRKLQAVPELRWSTKFVAPGTKLHGLKLPVFASADTRFVEDGGHATSEITLRIGVEQFDFQTHEALSYILLHECVCHLFQSAATRTQGVMLDVGYDMFSEGWVDSVVERIFRDLRANDGPATQFRDVLATQSQVCAGLELHFARGNASGSDSSSPFAPYIQRSRVAGDSISAELRRVLPVDASDDAYLQLTLDANVVLDDVGQRNDFVNGIITMSASALQSAVAQFVSDRDAANFIANISNL